MAAEAPIGVGIVGLSATRGWAATAHLPALQALPDYEVTALSTSTPESARAAAKAYGVTSAFADHRELVARPDVDLVVVAVKVPAHREIVTAALEGGKAVLCEWPLGNGRAETEELAALADQLGVRGFVGLQGRSAPVVRFVRDLVAAGEIGEVLSTTLVGSGDTWGATVHPSALYLLDRANGATMLTIPVGHAIDALAYCLGEVSQVAAVTATRRPSVTQADTKTAVPMTAEDQVAIAAHLANGAVATIHYRGGRSPGTNLLWEINGTKGTLVMKGRSGHIQYGMLELHAATGRVRDLAPLSVPPEYEEVALDPSKHAYTVAHAYARLARDLRNGTDLVPTFADAAARHRTLDAIDQAAATGQRCDLP